MEVKIIPCEYTVNANEFKQVAGETNHYQVQFDCSEKQLAHVVKIFDLLGLVGDWVELKEVFKND